MLLTIDSASIAATDKRVAANNKAMTWSGISMDYGKLCYAYPKSFGALTSIKDANNVDYINSYTRTEVTLTENGNSVVYYCYLLKDAAGVSSLMLLVYLISNKYMHKEEVIYGFNIW